MQTQKEYIQSAIVQSARDEFLEKGFRNTSLRTIAHNAEVTLSNIYNYFKDKDALFCFVFQPILDDIKEAMNQMEKMESQDDHSDEETHFELLNAPIEYVYHNKEMFKLLLFNSEGSSLYGIQDQAVKWFAHLMETSYEGMIKRHHLNKEKPSELFFHLLGSLWVHLIEDTLKHDLEPQVIKENANELMKFVFHGWVGFLEIKA